MQVDLDQLYAQMISLSSDLHNAGLYLMERQMDKSSELFRVAAARLLLAHNAIKEAFETVRQIGEVYVNEELKQLFGDNDPPEFPRPSVN